jgi:hypothetical protein
MSCKYLPLIQISCECAIIVAITDLFFTVRWNGERYLAQCIVYFVEAHRSFEGELAEVMNALWYDPHCSIPSMISGITI